MDVIFYICHYSLRLSMMIIFLQLLKYDDLFRTAVNTVGIHRFSEFKIKIILYNGRDILYRIKGFFFYVACALRWIRDVSYYTSLVEFTAAEYHLSDYIWENKKTVNVQHQRWIDNKIMLCVSIFEFEHNVHVWVGLQLVLERRFTVKVGSRGWERNVICQLFMLLEGWSPSHGFQRGWRRVLG